MQQTKLTTKESGAVIERANTDRASKIPGYALRERDKCEVSTP